MSGHAFFPTKSRLLDGSQPTDSGGAFSRTAPPPDDFSYFRPLGLSNRLTVSFPADGTSIFTHESSLYETFGHILSGAELEDSILRAFNTWTREGNVDVGVVEDSGDAFGTSGRTYDDDRFGDIRVGAYPMDSNVFAIAMSQSDFVSGTWAGDILFNSDADFADAGQFFSVALHEAGHALGLNHSEDPRSVMYAYSTNISLSQGDIENFRSLYGTRRLDSHDNDDGNNNSIADATELKFDSIQGPKGLYPSIIFGDISDSLDLDYFKIEVENDYTGTVSFRVVSEGISLLAPSITILDRDGQLILEDVSVSTRGDELVLSVSASDLGDKAYVRVEGASDSDTGSYSLITTLDDRLIVDEALISYVAKSTEFTFMDQEDIASYLSSPETYLFNDDDHGNDDNGNATVLESEDGYDFQSRFRFNASLLDGTDVDVYQIKTLEFNPTTTTNVLNVSLRSVVTGGMIPLASVFDSDGNELDANVVVNGRGEYVIQVNEIDPDTEYFVHVAADDFLPFNTGNYELTIFYSDRSIEFQEFAAGAISSLGRLGVPSQKRYHSLHVAESQMFQFAFEADALLNQQDAIFWVTIYDNVGGIVYQAATRDGERHTAEAAYFSPGSYTIEVEIGSITGRSSPTRQPLNYRLLGIHVGDPQGPVFNDPTHSPFQQNGNGAYLYPDDVISNATFVFVNGQSSNQPPPPDDDPPEDLYYWYWGLGI